MSSSATIEECAAGMPASRASPGEAEHASGDTKASGLFGAMAASLFETQDDGSVLFWPLGWWDRQAYRLPDQEKQTQVETSVRRSYHHESEGAGALAAVLEPYLSLWQLLGLAIPGGQLSLVRIGLRFGA